MDQEFLAKTKQMIVNHECLTILVNFACQEKEKGNEEAGRVLDRWDECRKRCYEEIGEHEDWRTR